MQYKLRKELMKMKWYQRLNKGAKRQKRDKSEYAGAKNLETVIHDFSKGICISYV